MSDQIVVAVLALLGTLAAIRERLALLEARIK